jgi:hypothetical protein
MGEGYNALGLDRIHLMGGCGSVDFTTDLHNELRGFATLKVDVLCWHKLPLCLIELQLSAIRARSLFNHPIDPYVKPCSQPISQPMSGLVACPKRKGLHRVGGSPTSRMQRDQPRASLRAVQRHLEKEVLVS